MDVDADWSVDGIPMASGSMTSLEKTRGGAALTSGAKIGEMMLPGSTGDAHASQSSLGAGIISPLQRHIQFLNRQANGHGSVSLDGNETTGSILQQRANGGVLGQNVVSLDAGISSLASETSMQANATPTHPLDQRAGPAVSVYSNKTGHTVTGRPASRAVSNNYAASSYQQQQQHPYNASISGDSSMYASHGGAYTEDGYTIQGNDGSGSMMMGSGSGNKSSFLSKYAGASGNRLSKLMSGGRRKN